MSQYLRCPNGHQWLMATEPVTGGEAARAVCPTCGAAAIAGTEEVELPLPPQPTPPLPAVAAVAAQILSPGRAVPAPALEVGHIFAERFKLREKLGEGGMGTVFVADQLEPVQRRVALKVIKSSVNSSRLPARFEHERQALALMDHPNIAKVLDAGLSAEGQPYFVMELVKGVALTKYCDDARLTPRQRLELFVPVCQAVQHAHQKGIIHRDLKPTNILVGLYDGRPVPKVIDFGVAKATGPRLSEQTVYTEVGSLIGTLEYMSPEQAELNNLDIDTRSDLYALGVILYELLTGSVPFARQDLQSAGFAEMLRVIKEVDPPRPSTKLSGSGQLPAVAAVRQTEPRKLARLVRGELDWIVMKCLEKERSRRYETANGLAMDVHRYLADEPVQAGPPSASYRVRKFVRRNRKAVLAASVAFLAIILGALGATVGMIRAAHAEQRATAARDAALAAEQAAKESEEDTQAFSRFLVDDVLSTARPTGWQGGLGIDVTVRRALDEAAKKLGDQFQGRPRAEAVARVDVGQTYLLLGERALVEPHFRRALELRRRSLGPDHKDTLATQRRLGVLLAQLGRREEAVPLLEKTLEQCRTLLGPDHVETLYSIGELAYGYHLAGRTSEALTTFENAVRLTTEGLGADDPTTLRYMNLQAAELKRAGRPVEAVQLYEKVLALKKVRLGPEHPNTLISMASLTEAYEEAGRDKEALPLYEELLKQSRIQLGSDHPYTLQIMTSMIWSYHLAGRNADAIRLGEETVKVSTVKHGADDPMTLAASNNLALAYLDAGQAPKAVQILEETVRLKKRKLGDDDPETLKGISGLAAAYREVGRLPEAVKLHEHVVTASRAKIGDDHPNTLAAMSSLALSYQDAGRMTEALALYEEALRRRKAKLGFDHPATLTSMHNLAWGYQHSDRLAEAVPLYVDALRLRKAKLGAEHPATLTTQFNLATTYRLQGDAGRAETSYVDLLAVQRKIGADPYVAGTQAILGTMLLQQKRYAEAEPRLRECLDLRKKAQPNHWLYFSAHTLLGESLFGQQKFVEAEGFLRQGYEGLKARQKLISPEAKNRLPQTLGQLVELYGALGKPDEAAKWQAELKAVMAASQQPKEK